MRLHIALCTDILIADYIVTFTLEVTLCYVCSLRLTYAIFDSLCLQVDDATVLEMVSILEKYPITRTTLEVSFVCFLFVCLFVLYWGTRRTSITPVSVCVCVDNFRLRFRQVCCRGSDHSDCATKRHCSTRIERRLVVRSIPKAAHGS